MKNIRHDQLWLNYLKWMEQYHRKSDKELFCEYEW